MPILETNEFSICLKPKREIVDAVNDIRKQLPPSPYRDDPPHVTLIRGIVSDKAMSDNELVSKVATITHINKRLPLTGYVTGVANRSNPFYSESGVLIIKPSGNLQLLRSDALELLGSQGFSDESHDNNTHSLHITIRLGIKLEDGILAQTRKRFLNMPATLTHWFLFRLRQDNGARKMHQVNPHNN